MRPIKFRLWDKERKVMEEVGAIDWADGKNGLEVITVNTRTEKHYKMPDDWGEQPFAIMQFTGLHDKNGKEIYEGDIVDFDGWKTENPFYIEWDEVNCGFVIVGIRNKVEETMHESDAYEVIGNIYENSELLKV